MKRGAFVAASVLTLLAGACTASRVDPNAKITIRGSVLSQTGKPVTAARVILGREPDLGEVLGATMSLGLICLGDETVPVCHGNRLTTTDGRGRFGYSLRGSDTQGSVRNASTMVLTSSYPRSGDELAGPGETYRFQVQTTALDLPIRFWQPSVKATTTARSIRVEWSALPPTLLPRNASLDRVTTSIAFTSADGTDVWTYSPARSGGDLDPRPLEDSQGGFAVQALTRGVSVSDQLGTAIDTIWQSGRFRYEGPSGAPASRGAACFVPDAKGHLVAQASCKLTDGNFKESFHPTAVAPCASPGAPGCIESPHTSAIIDLGAVKTAALVVIRGCRTDCGVEISGNERTWRLIGSGNDGDTALSPAGSPRGRYIRVSSQGDVDDLREVSVWDAAAKIDPGQPLSRALARIPTAPPSSRGVVSGTIRNLIIGAVVLALIAIGAFILGMRGRKQA